MYPRELKLSLFWHYHCFGIKDVASGILELLLLEVLVMLWVAKFIVFKWMFWDTEFGVYDSECVSSLETQNYWIILRTCEEPKKISDFKIILRHNPSQQWRSCGSNSHLVSEIRYQDLFRLPAGENCLYQRYTDNWHVGWSLQKIWAPNICWDNFSTLSLLIFLKIR